MSEPPVETHVPQRRRPLWRGVLNWAFGIVLVLVVLVAVGWAVLHLVAARAIETELVKIREAGQPRTFAELVESQPPVAEADDAAPLYQAARDLWRESTNQKVDELLDKLHDPSAPAGAMSAELAADIEALLADNAEVLELVDRGSARPQCAYDLGISDERPLALPQFSDMRYLAKLLCLRTEYLARQGRGSKAVASLISGLRVTRMFDYQPVLISWLVKIACVSLQMNSVPTVLEMDELSDEDLVALEAALAEAEPSESMEDVWIAERLIALGISRPLICVSEDFLPGDFPQRRTRRWSWAGRPVIRLLIASELRMYARRIEADRLGWPEARDAIHEMAAEKHGVSGTFRQILTPSLAKALDLLGRTIGSVRSARVAVMADRYRLAHGELPETLEQLREFIGADLPADPFTGRDLVYKKTDDSYVVYTVGEDKTDDGGPDVAKRADFGVVIHH